MNRITLFVQGWFHLFNKKHFLNEAVQFVLTFFEDSKIFGNIISINALSSDLLADLQVFVFFIALMVSACIADITCITQFTLKSIYNALLAQEGCFFPLILKIKGTNQDQGFWPAK